MFFFKPGRSFKKLVATLPLVSHKKIKFKKPVEVNGFSNL